MSARKVGLVARACKSLTMSIFPRNLAWADPTSATRQTRRIEDDRYIALDAANERTMKVMATTAGFKRLSTVPRVKRRCRWPRPGHKRRDQSTLADKMWDCVQNTFSVHLGLLIMRFEPKSRLDLQIWTLRQTLGYLRIPNAILLNKQYNFNACDIRLTICLIKWVTADMSYMNFFLSDRDISSDTCNRLLSRIGEFPTMTDQEHTSLCVLFFSFCSVDSPHFFPKTGKAFYYHSSSSYCWIDPCPTWRRLWQPIMTMILC